MRRATALAVAVFGAFAAASLPAAACAPAQVQARLEEASGAFDALRGQADGAALREHSARFARTLATLVDELGRCECAGSRTAFEEAAEQARRAAAATDDDALVDALNEAAQAFGQGLDRLGAC